MSVPPSVTVKQIFFNHWLGWIEDVKKSGNGRRKVIVKAKIKILYIV